MNVTYHDVVRGLLLLVLCGCDVILGLHPPPPDAPADASDASIDADTTCPVDYQPLAIVGSVYRLGEMTTNWYAAAADCADDSAVSHLIVVNSDAERIVLESASGGFSRWIGLTDMTVEGTFVWSSTQSVAPPPASGPPWGAGQPDAQTALQDCVRMEGTSGGSPGFFDDAECTSGFRYMCECDGYAAVDRQ